MGPMSAIDHKVQENAKYSTVHGNFGELYGRRQLSQCAPSEYYVVAEHWEAARTRVAPVIDIRRVQ
jgi:hypothetical protein